MALEIVSVTRPAAGEPAGMLVLLHGRGTSEQDLLPLADALDPGRRLVAVLPRAPLRLPPGGNHWYVTRELGWPDPDTFLPTLVAAGDWVDAAAAANRVEPDQVVLAGFSQGCVMAHALGLGAGRPRPGGIIALSGFVPNAPGFELDLASRTGMPVAIGHGTLDQVIPVEWGRQARMLLEGAGMAVRYRETVMGHGIDPEYVDELSGWLADVVSGR
jgi:phospholipase/carboxylesterase